MKKKLLHIVTVVTCLFLQNVVLAQAPNLGSVAKFVVFSTNGAVTNNGISHYTGDVGANAGSVSGFGNVNGSMQVINGASAAAAADLLTAYNQLNGIAPDFFPAPLLGNGDTLIAGVYSIAGVTTLSGNLVLDARGNANAVFIFKLQAAFSTTANAKVKLINGAQACNVFWKVEGLVGMATGTFMRGTVIANNAAIVMTTNDTLEGRALSTTGGISGDGVVAYTPTGCESSLLRGPVPPALGPSKCYAILTGNGSVINTLNSFVTGDIGTNLGVVAGFNSLQVTGTVHPIPDVSTGDATNDLLNVNTYLNGLSPDIELLYPAQFGNDLVLTPHTYLLNAATVLTGTLYLNAEGNPNAVFVIKMSAAFETGTSAKVVLLNGAQAKNVYWKVTGATKLADYTEFAGTIVSNGAIDLLIGATLNGRALTTTGAINTSNVTVTMPPGCGLNTYTWLGGGGDWNTPSMWSANSVPSGCAAEVFIPSGVPFIFTPVTVGSIDISSGASLVVSSPLNVCGSFTGGTGAPVITFGPGTISLNGTAQQTILGNIDFARLELNNTAGANIVSGSNIGITGVYTPTTGTLVTNNEFTLKSSVDGTAIIAPGTGTYISGNTTVERYMPAKRAWRYLTAPLSNTGTIYANWQNSGSVIPARGVEIWSPAGAPGIVPGGSAPSIKQYNENSDTWSNLANTTATNLSNYDEVGINTVGDNKAYALFVAGHFGLGNISSTLPASITTLISSGTINMGQQSFTYNNLAADRFIMVGNPYAAPVNFLTVGKSNIKNTFWAWDPQRNGTTLGGYVTVSWDPINSVYDIDYPSNQTAQTQYIQNGQAVLVQVATGSTTSVITFNETDKQITGSTNGVFREAGTGLSQQLRIVLSRRTSDTSQVAVDGVLSKFDTGYVAAAGIDDAVKLYNYDENMSLKRNGVRLSIERRPTVITNDTLYLNIDGLKANSTYRLELDGSNFDGQLLNAFLVDKFLGVQTPVSLTAPGVVSFTIDGTTASADPSRFMVIFKPSSTLPITFTGLKAWQTGQAIQVEWNVQNETGIQRYIVEKSADMRSFIEVTATTARNNNVAETYTGTDMKPFAGDNFYRIKTIEKAGAVNYSSVVKVHLSEGAPAFTVFPNPVKDRNVSLQLVNVTRGAYSLLLYDQSGKLLQTDNVNHLGNSSGYVVLLPAGIAPGTYHFLLKGKEKNSPHFTQYLVVQ